MATTKGTETLGAGARRSRAAAELPRFEPPLCPALCRPPAIYCLCFFLAAASHGWPSCARHHPSTNSCSASPSPPCQAPTERRPAPSENQSRRWGCASRSLLVTVRTQQKHGPFSSHPKARSLLQPPLHHRHHGAVRSPAVLGAAEEGGGGRGGAARGTQRWLLGARRGKLAPSLPLYWPWWCSFCLPPLQEQSPGLQVFQPLVLFFQGLKRI